MLPQYAGVHPFIAFFANLAFLNILAGLILFFLVPPPVALFCLFTGILFILASRKSTARRYLISSHFRPPAHLRASEFLLYHRRRLIFVNYGVVIVATLVCFLSFRNPTVQLVSVALLSGFSGIILIAAIKMHLKFWLDSHFRIVVFRRYEGEASLLHKARVLPVPGFYGQILLFEDDKLSGAWEGGRMRMDQWVFAELYQPLVADRDTDKWRELVCQQLCYADFVLFDWSSEITDNMIWELDRAIELVPSDRIMVLASPESRKKVESIVAAHEPSGYARQIVASPTNAMGEALFTVRFMQTMSALRPLPRPAGHLADAKMT